MTLYTTPRMIDLAALPFPATLRTVAGGWQVEADQPLTTLQAAVDAAPDDQTATREANRSALATQAGADLTVLRASVDTLQGIIDKTNASIGPADTKQIARECRRIARQIIALTRLVTGDTSSTDTGSA